MLSRSLFKPMLTCYFSKAVLFAQTNTGDHSQELSANFVKQANQSSLKKSRIKSFFTFNFATSNQKNLVSTTPSLKISSNSFGSFFTKANTLKLVNQLPGYEPPTFIFFSNFCHIPISLCGKRIAVYNGKLFMPILVKRSLLGVSFRHLVKCKRLGRVIHGSSLSTKVKKKIQK